MPPPSRSSFVALACLVALAGVVLGEEVLVNEVPLPRSTPRYATGLAPLGLGVERVNVKRVPGERIVGGDDARLGQFPHQASMQVTLPSTLWLYRRAQHICGGSLIAAGWVLSAAHCVYGVPNAALKVEVVLGIDNLLVDAAGHQRILVSRMLVHSKYDHYANSGVGPFDIAMLKLARPAVESDTVKIISLPGSGVLASGDATLSGWGSTSSNGMRPVYPNQLQTAVFPIVPYDECVTFAAALDADITSQFRDTNLCVGPLDRVGLSSCSGDSGGPLIQTDDVGKSTVIGVVSWGLVNCGSFPFPSVFTRVSAYINWIDDVINKH